VLSNYRIGGKIEDEIIRERAAGFLLDSLFSIRTQDKWLRNCRSWGDSDDVFFDMIRRFIYVIGDEGAVDIFRMRDPNHYDYVGRRNTAAGAYTGLFVSGLDRLFVAVPHRGSLAARLLVYQIGQSVR
jgi:hypothetical protein